MEIVRIAEFPSMMITSEATASVLTVLKTIDDIM